jgi:hypothetical protein
MKEIRYSSLPNSTKSNARFSSVMALAFQAQIMTDQLIRHRECRTCHYFCRSKVVHHESCLWSLYRFSALHQYKFQALSVLGEPAARKKLRRYSVFAMQVTGSPLSKPCRVGSCVTFCPSPRADLLLNSQPPALLSGGFDRLGLYILLKNHRH